MWALGCVLYTLLCGFPPFYDESIEVLTEKVAKGQYTFLSPWWDDISKSAQDLISHLLDVDPEKRYTITEFLNHPWIRTSGPTPRDEKKIITPDNPLRAFDANKIVDGDRRYDFRSPGAVNLREVFDVGYAVHRQEEEVKRRKQVGSKAAGVPSRLVGLDEESDEDEDMADAYDDSKEYVHKGTTQNATQQLEQSMRNTNIRDQEHRGRQREREKHGHYGGERGYGQHSAAVTAAARQQVRDSNRQKGAFELNLDGATLLGRRGVKPSARVA
jgi:serine/threonine-protein kinase RCK2